MVPGGKDIGVWRQANGTTLRGEGSSSDRMVRESRVRNHVPAEWFLNSVAESRFRLNGFRTGKRNHGPALMVRSKGERNHGSRLMVRSKRKRNHGPGEWCLSKKKRNHGPGSMQKRQKLGIFCDLRFSFSEITVLGQWCRSEKSGITVLGQWCRSEKSGITVLINGASAKKAESRS